MIFKNKWDQFQWYVDFIVLVIMYYSIFTTENTIHMEKDITLQIKFL